MPDGIDVTVGSEPDDTVLMVGTGPDGIAVTLGWGSVAINNNNLLVKHNGESFQLKVNNAKKKE